MVSRITFVISPRIMVAAEAPKAIDFRNNYITNKSDRVKKGKKENKSYLSPQNRVSAVRI